MTKKKDLERRMLINVVEKGEARVAILENGQLEELYVERESQDQLVGNIYKAKVVNVEPSIQAAFVEFGGARNGFLHVSDIHRSNYHEKDASVKPAGKSSAKGSGRGRARVAIQSVIKRGQELIVQVAKESVGNKAPGVTSYISLPGRYLVLMPALTRRGVSRKIEDEQERARLKHALVELGPSKNMGFIVRTAGVGKTKRALQRDMRYLMRVWDDVTKRAKKAAGPGLLYRETDLAIRSVRDYFTSDIAEMLIDSEEKYRKVLEFMRVTMPRSRGAVKLYSEAEPLFHRYKIEEQIERIHHKRVPLPGGAYLVIDQTEALVAIDVNSGRFKKGASAEETAFKINLAAAKEIARQVRLRDLGGVIVNDFIDMADEERQREVERALWEAVKRDRARTRMLRMSRFGLVEMTRQRVRHSVLSSQYRQCPSCGGAGQVKTVESCALGVFRRIRFAAGSADVARIEVRGPADVVSRMGNDHRRELARLEEGDLSIQIEAAEDLGVENVDIKCYKTDGKLIQLQV